LTEILSRAELFASRLLIPLAAVIAAGVIPSEIWAAGLVQVLYPTLEMRGLTVPSLASPVSVDLLATLPLSRLVLLVI
jgi:hypothetical protein